jgi:hypothetical protein
MRHFYIILGLILFFPFSYSTAQEYIKLELNQPDPLQVNVGDDQELTEGESVILGIDNMVSGGTGDVVYTWDPSTYLSDPTAPRPSSKPEQDITYILSVKDANNCVVSDTVNLRVAKITGLEDGIEINAMIYPNPSKGSFVIEINSISRPIKSIHIYDLNGLTIFQSKEVQPQNDKINIELKQVPSGTYMMILKGDDLTTTRKIIIE